VWIAKTRFNYETESWSGAEFDLPWIGGDFVIPDTQGHSH
jgi:hypothetical protein